MRAKKRLPAALLAALLLLLLPACAAQPAPTATPEPTPAPTPAPTPEPTLAPGALKPYDEARGEVIDDLRNLYGAVYAPDMYRPEDIYTYTFDDTTVFTGSEALAAEILETGKDPGLGVRGLHEQGVTGEGVNVAIIDQNMFLDHPEFAGKIVEYWDGGYDYMGTGGSMHGPGVTSLLVGETVGVAPGARVYYAATPSGWDAQYEADALRWIIETNEALPEGEKIRVVSVSSAPAVESAYANAEMWVEAVDEAQAAGIMVIDCSDGYDTSFIVRGLYDPDDRQSSEGCNNHPDATMLRPGSDYLLTPCYARTVAEQHYPGEYHYRYDGEGGLSWAIPYAAGVLALGWQLRPDLDADTMRALLLSSAALNAEGYKVIDPVAFVEAVQAAP